MTVFLIHRKRLLKELGNLSVAAAGLVAAFGMRFEFVLTADQLALLVAALPVACAIKALVFRGFGLRDLGWRYVGFADLARLVGANLAASLLVAASLRWSPGTALPRSISLLDFVLCTSMMIAVHAAARGSMAWRSGKSTTPRRILIYGAGKAGLRVLAEIRGQAEIGVRAVGFLDDDASKRNLRLHGLRVLGTRADLPRIAHERRVEEVWLALAGVAASDLAEILALCQAANLPAKRVPPLAELMQDKVLVHQIRELRLEDLLGRPAVQLQEAAISSHLEGETVLVTGAAGSIGSELCRQIARFSPRALIGVDQAETPLFEIAEEMRKRFPGVVFSTEIADIRNRQRIAEIFHLHSPGVVYHAAAYKHVPMMEHQLFEAIENNVFGTLNLAQAASLSQVKTFVLVSSDKAVRPANIMGATKRAAEIVCQAMPKKGQPPRHFLAVRFGNVLGSSGSVIPLFQRQIAQGGPLTVTHPEMRRYFMTIPEAAQLVLQAAALGAGGEIFVLEMGEPVRILDLARKMVLLSGLKPDADIAIEFSGTRPGEKLFEELYVDGEEMLSTKHEQIRVFQSPPHDHGTVAEALAELRQQTALRDSAGVLLCLKKLIPDYNPSTTIIQRAFDGRAQATARAARAG